MENSDVINLFIVDNDLNYGHSLKRSLELEFDERVNVKFFADGESCVQEIKNNGKNDMLVVLDYFGNKQPEIKDSKHTVDDITKIEPQKGIIILSVKKYINRSIKGPVHSTHDQVANHNFAFDHVINSVKRCLSIPRV